MSAYKILYFTKLFCLWVCLLLLATPIYAGSKYNKPYYTVQLDISNCVYDVRINDALLFEENEGFPVRVELPINHWLKDGSNIISAYLKPYPGEKTLRKDCDFLATVYVRESGSKRDARIEVVKLEYSSQKGGEKPLKIEKSFNVSVPFPKWKWMSAEPLKEDQETLAAIIKKLKDFHSLLKNKDLEKVVNECEVKYEEIAAAYYDPLKDHQDRRRNEFKELMDGWELYDLEWPIRVDESDFSDFGGNEKQIFNALMKSGYIDKKGTVLPKINGKIEDFRIDVPLSAEDKRKIFDIVKERKENLVLRVYGNGCLAEVKTKTGASPLVYYDEKRDLSSYIPLIFSKINGELIIVR
ncbi:MAG: hypothetical protein ABIH22_02015 [Candidatus Margulisiibacteriota bacterium]